MPLMNISPKLGEFFENLSGQSSLQFLDNSCRSLIGPCRKEKMQMVGHNFQSKQLVLMLFGNLSSKSSNHGCNIFGQNWFSILRYPYHVIVDIIDRVSCNFRLIHTCYFNYAGKFVKGKWLLFPGFKSEVCEAGKLL